MSDNKARICWLTGSYYHRKDIIAKINDQFKPENTYVYDGECSASYLEMQIMGAELFTPKRSIILKEIPPFEGSSQTSNKKWKKVIQNIPEDCIVIVDGVSPGKKQVIYKLVKKVGKIFDMPEYLDKSKALTYASSLFEEYNKKIDQVDVEKLINSVREDNYKGVNVDFLRMAILQVIYFVGKKKKNIKSSDIMLAVPKSSQFIIWDIFDAIDHRDYILCHKLYKMACDREGICQATQQILHMLLWRFKMLLFIKEQQSKNFSNKDIENNLSMLNKTKKTGSGLYATFEYDLDKKEKKKPIYSYKMINNTINGMFGKKAAIDFYNRTDIFKTYIVLCECIAKMRETSTDINCQNMFDNFIDFICEKRPKKILERLRRRIDA
ncbi:MAG: DNA polymerase III subunit delta [Elusimicrobiota bacterium]